MSVEALAIALHHSRATGAAKLVLIGIANHDGDGGAWPAVATLAKYAKTDRRNVQRYLNRLEEWGEIRRLISQGGDHSTPDHRRPNLYRFTLGCPHDCDRTKNHRTKRDEPLYLDIPELDGAVNLPAVNLPQAVKPPPGGAVNLPHEPSLELNNLSTESASSTGARVGLEPHGALLQVAADNADQVLWRIIHQPCPMRRDGREHSFTNTGCTACGIRTDQRWDGGDIAMLDDLVAAAFPPPLNLPEQAQEARA